MAHRINFLLGPFLLALVTVGCGGLGPRASEPVTQCQGSNCSACADGTFLSDGACVDVTLCQPGTYVAQAASAVTDRVCAACPSGTFSATSNSGSCVAWADCNRGSYVAAEPSARADRVCASCADGTSTSGPNQSTCLASTACPAGTVQTAPGTATEAPVCKPCTAGQFCAGGTAAALACTGDTWDHDGKPATACVAMTQCSAGTYIVNPGSATQNRACSPCPQGSFSSGSNVSACSPWSDCAPGTYVTNVPSAGADRICKPCPTGTVATEANQSTCLAAEACPAGTVQTSGATATSERVCKKCTAGQFCAGGTTPPVDCSGDLWDDDQNPATVCVPKTLCAAGSHVNFSGSSTTNRTCVDCAVGTFNASTNAAACTPWSTCQTGSYVSSMPSAISDRQCAPCTPGTYTTTANQPECISTGCSAGSVQTAAATASSPAVCQPCLSGEYCAGGDQPAVPCGTGDWDKDGDPATACVPWTSCGQSGVLTPGTATTDQVCVLACDISCATPEGTVSNDCTGPVGGEWSCNPVCDSSHAACGAPQAGCTSDISSEVANCGGCARACSTAGGATPSCTASQCQAPTCSDGRASCNDENVKRDGCEVDTKTDSNNCGGCGVQCTGGTCSNGVCVTTSGPNVLLVAADGGNDLRTRLEAFGDLGSVAVFDAGSATPTPTDLQSYGVVILWSEALFADSTTLGNVLADYVDGGGRVILADFSLNSADSAHPGGRFQTSYSPVEFGPWEGFGEACLGTYVTTHPIMTTPTAITDVCDSYRIATTLASDSSTVAWWDDGTIFVAVKNDRTVVAVNGYPGALKAYTGQLDAVIHNAIWYLYSP